MGGIKYAYQMQVSRVGWLIINSHRARKNSSMHAICIGTAFYLSSTCNENNEIKLQELWDLEMIFGKSYSSLSWKSIVENEHST